MSGRPQVGVAVLVVRDDPEEDCLLLGLRRGAHGAGTWGAVGGMIEPGETPERAALRELAEETDIVVPIDDLWRLGETPEWTFDMIDGNAYVTLWFTVVVHAGTVATVREPAKCSEWRWTPRSAALPEPLFQCMHTLHYHAGSWAAIWSQIAPAPR